MTNQHTTKKQHTISGLTFDNNLSGLHKPEQAVDILGKKVRFLAPSIIQKALMVRFLILSFQEMVTTEKERQTLSFDALWSKCVIKLSELQVEAATPEELTAKQLTMGRMFANPDANSYLIKAIQQSFPDFSEPELLTEEAFMQAATTLIQSMQI